MHTYQAAAAFGVTLAIVLSTVVGFAVYEVTKYGAKAAVTWVKDKIVSLFHKGA